MHTDKNKIIFSDYCHLSEMGNCKLKLKSRLFSTFCQISKESRRYVFTYWYSIVPLVKNSNSVQLSINAIIKDKQSDTDDFIRKIIPYTKKSLFSAFSAIFKLGKNYNKKIIGEEKMVIKCPKCGFVIPVSNSGESTLLREEIKNKDLIIESLRKDNEELIKTIEELQKITKGEEIKNQEPECPVEENVNGNVANENEVEESKEIVEEKPEVQIEATTNENGETIVSINLAQPEEPQVLEQNEEAKDDLTSGIATLSEPDAEGFQELIAPEGYEGEEVKESVEPIEEKIEEVGTTEVPTTEPVAEENQPVVQEEPVAEKAPVVEQPEKEPEEKDVIPSGEPLQENNQKDNSANNESNEVIKEEEASEVINEQKEETNENKPFIPTIRI